MTQSALLRGVSACALMMACAHSTIPNALAQEALPTIDISAETAPSGGGAAPSGTSSDQPTSVWSPTLPDGSWAFVKKYQIPNAVVSSITRQEIDRRVNIIYSQDAIKYLPSLYVNENRGGSQGSLQTRTFGNNQVRNLVYLDGIPLNSLHGGNGSFYGGMQINFKLVSPEEIERVDYISGPFAAQYPGNSMGGVLTYTTRMPEKFEFSAKETVSVEDYHWWGVDRAFPKSVTALTLGDRYEKFSWFLSSNYTTYQAAPTGSASISAPPYPYVYGGMITFNRLGVPSEVVGTGAMMDGDLVNSKLKVAYDFTPTMRLQHTVGVFTEDRNMHAETFYSNNNSRWYTWFGQPNRTIGNFISYFGRHQDNVLVNSLSLRQNSNGVFDFDLTASHFYYMTNVWNSPYALAGTGFTSTGVVRKETGDYWATLDLKGIYRPFGPGGAHEMSFGFYADQAHLVAPTYTSLSWPSGQAANVGNFYTSMAKGTTRTQALWLQEVFRFHPDFKLTTGIRAEQWKASDGYNQSATADASGGFISKAPAPVFQPVIHHARYSPKGTLEWKPDEDWKITASVGLANRFPTVSELYSLTTPQGALNPVNPNPNLRPEVALNKELTFQRDFRSGGSFRVSLFDDEIRDYIISQTIPIQGTLVTASAPTNVARVRNSGVEVDLHKDNVLFEGLEVFANATYLSSHIVSNPLWRPGTCAISVSATQDCWAATVDGKRTPGNPRWRWKAGLTFKPDDRWSFSLQARWFDYYWQTMANNDVSCCNVGAGFGLSQRIFMVDAKVHYRWNERFSFDFGVNNIGAYKTTMGTDRTYVAAMRYKFGGDEKNTHGVFFTGDEGGVPDVASWFRPTAFSID